jgi:DNA-binding CsgD family transcriptional regulator
MLCVGRHQCAESVVERAQGVRRRFIVGLDPVRTEGNRPVSTRRGHTDGREVKPVGAPVASVRIPEDIADDTPISSDDLRAIIGILAEIAGMTEPLSVRKKVLMNRLCPLLGAERWIWTTSANFERGKTPTGIAVSYGGFTEREFGIIIEASQDVDVGMPENEPMIEAVLAHGHVTRTRSDFIGDDDFYTHPQWTLYRKPAGTDQYLFSLYPIGNGYLSGIGFHRLPGQPDFSARERRIIHLVASQVTWLHLADVPMGTDASFVEDLSPRLRTVFAFLLQGWNRKQIAEHLGITQNTAAGYIKSIYRYFGVASQVQLLSRFVRGDGGDAASTS